VSADEQNQSVVEGERVTDREADDEKTRSGEDRQQVAVSHVQSR
jgi:hypothetical protein